VKRRRLPLAIVGLAVALLAGIALAHDAVATLVVHAVARGMGYQLREARLTVGLSSASLIDPVVTTARGEPLFAADRIDVRYVLRDLLPGGRRRFGLQAVDVERPRVTLIHEADGSYNVGGPSSGAAQRPDETPFDVRIRVRDGTIAFVDRFVVPGRERRESLEGVSVDAILAPTDPSYYRVDATLVDAGRRYPIAGRARFDHARRFAAQHWWAPELPIGPLANFALSTHTVNVVSGRLLGLDARVYGFVQNDGSTDTHVGVHAQLADGTVYARQLALPVRDAHGPLYLTSDGFQTTGIDATLAGAPLHVAGGAYDLAHPTLRFVVTARGPLDRLKTIAAAAAKRPLAGDVALTMHVDGALSAPRVEATFDSQRFRYARFAFDRAGGTLVVQGQTLQLVEAHARYGPLALRGAGTLVLAKHVAAHLVTTVAGPSDALPYANQLLPATAMRGVVVLDGVDAHLGASGSLTARGPGGTLDAPFAVAADGIGTVGPVAFARRDGATAYARLDIDRPRGAVTGIVAANRLALLRARPPMLPGIDARALPALRGALDAAVALDVANARLDGAAGALHVRDASLGALALGDVDARIGGAGERATLQDLRVRGPLADVDGDGAYADGTLAIEGRARTTFARLRGLLRGVPANGAIDAPFRAVLDASAQRVQVDGGRFDGARLRGVALRDASATIVRRGDALEVAALRVGVAGGTVVARGTLGEHGVLVASAGGIDPSALGTGAVPLRGGTLTALVAASGTPATPRATLAATLSGGTLRAAPLDVRLFAHYDGERAAIDEAGAAYGGAVATLDGSVGGLRPGAIAPRLDLAAHLRGLDVGTLAAAAHVPLRYPDAGADGDVRITGTPGAPRVDGTARIAAGSVNGLAFHDVVVPIHGGLDALAVTGGRATVGTTTLAFDARASRAGARVSVRAPHLDLANFNDYFDAADTLHGRGRAAVALTLGSHGVSTNGAVALRDTEVRRLPIGDVAATWSTRGRTIVAQTTVGGTHGTLRAHGSATLPARDPLHRLAASDVDVDATVVSLDLSTWLPALGVHDVPVVGRVDASARVHGVAPDLTLAATATATGAQVGRVPIRRLALAASAEHGRARVTSAELDLLNLHATASGTAGFGARDPIDLTLLAQTPDIGALALGVTGKTYALGGAFDGSLHVGGTRVAPSVEAIATVDRPRYAKLVATRAHLDLAFAGERLTLRDASLDEPAGRVAMSASVPATMRPPFVDRRDAALQARIVAQHLDLGDFSGAFPNGTKLGGVVDGDVRVGGTLASPSLGGSLALAKGSYSSPLLASPVQNAALSVELADRTATVTALHADMGGGAIDGSGTATVGDLRAPERSLAFDLDARAKNVGLDVPKLLRAKMDGAVRLSRANGAPMRIGGDLAFTHARLSVLALVPKGGAKGGAPPFPIAFDLTVAAPSDDRLQGPNIDVGATGRAVLGGTLAAPTLAGHFRSTDGSLSFYRTFVLQSASVAFDPSDGIIPFVDATATTHVPDPSTDVLLHAYGPATGLTLDLASRPEYDKSQIVGLLVNAQALGAVSGVAQTSPSSGGGLQNAALGFASSQFTSTIFKPFNSSIGNALGFQTFAFSPDLTGGFTASATRRLGEHVTASFADEQTQDGQRQSVGISGNFSDDTSVQLTLYGGGQTVRPLGAIPPFALSQPSNLELEALVPPQGSNGFIFSFVRKFWAGKPPAPTVKTFTSEPAAPPSASPAPHAAALKDDW